MKPGQVIYEGGYLDHIYMYKQVKWVGRILF